MRIAVIGGSGLTGRHTVAALERAGHDAVVVARSAGADVLTGEGLDRALEGADASIDVTNFPAREAHAADELFGTAAANVVAAATRAGVRHHVLLSIVNVDRNTSSAHYAGKRAQERVVQAAPIPWTILRATQFHEFAGQVVGWSRQGDTARIPPLLLQPVAAADVGAELAAIAAGAATRGVVELAGPETQDLVDMARRTLAARGEHVKLIPTWRGGSFGVDAAGEVFLPGPGARIAPTTFDAWLETLGR